jgi:hypothetical protein
VFTCEEAEVLISHPGIPLDRRMVYALGVLAGLRAGEAAALRWRHYDATTAPLGKLTVVLAYNTRCAPREDDQDGCGAPRAGAPDARGDAGGVAAIGVGGDDGAPAGV